MNLTLILTLTLTLPLTRLAPGGLFVLGTHCVDNSPSPEAAQATTYYTLYTTLHSIPHTAHHTPHTTHHTQRYTDSLPLTATYNCGEPYVLPTTTGVRLGAAWRGRGAY